jgi:serine/threonine-protein kinase
MSPEQMKSAKGVDARGDVWSLGVILFELVAGRPPFIAETLGALMSAVLSESPPALETIIPDVPPGYAALVASCLERDRAKRPDVAQLARRLAPYAPAAMRPLAERIAAIQLKSTDPRSARTLPGNVSIPSPQSASQPRVALAAATAKTSQTSTSWGDERRASQRRRTGKLAIAIGGIAVFAIAATITLNAALGHRKPGETNTASGAPGASNASSAASLATNATSPTDTTVAEVTEPPSTATAASTEPQAAHTTHAASTAHPMIDNPATSATTTASTAHATPPPQPSATATTASTTTAPTATTKATAPTGTRSGIFDRN